MVSFRYKFGSYNANTEVDYRIDGVSVSGYVSNDYGQLENMRAHDGRFPQYDNEIAMPKLLADRLGKGIGDSVSVKANGVTLDCIVTGFFSATSNSGKVGALTLDGYNRHDPNYKRLSIFVYLNEDESIEAFIKTLERQYGVLNIYHNDESDRFAAAKARAEEKITNYMEYYGIDSVEYAVMYNNEIILNGSSSAYQIEQIINGVDYMKTQLGTYSSAMSAVMRVVSVISLIIIALIITMSVRQIIIKRRRELGILKAAGFTSRELALQMAISFLPCAAVGIGE